MKNNKRIIIIAVLMCVVVMGALVACKKKTNTQKLDPVVVTDKNGVAYTDENGEVITIIPEGEILEVTNANGKKVHDENGEVKTSIRYDSQLVGVPVTDNEGKAITEKDGKWQTTKIWVPETTGSETQITVTVPITDAQGSTVTDKHGDVVTETSAVKESVVSTVVTVPVTDAQGSKVTDAQGSTVTETSVVSGAAGTTIITMPLTDSQGVTVTDGDGEAITYTAVSSVPTVDPTPNTSDYNSTFGGTGNDSFVDVAPTSDGGFVALMTSTSKDGSLEGINEKYGDQNSVIVKYNQEGIIQWKKFFGGNDGLSLVALATAANGDIAAVGYTKSTDLGETNYGNYDAIVYVLKSTGDVSWSSMIGGSQTEAYNGVTFSKDGSVIAVGFSYSRDGTAKAFGVPKKESAAVIAKYSAEGNLVFAKKIGSTTDALYSVAVDSTGNIYSAGSFSSDTANSLFKPYGKADGAVIKFDSEGNELWHYQMGGSKIDRFATLMVTSDDSVIVVGRSESKDEMMANLGNHGGYDAVIVKINPDGTAAWVNSFKGYYDDSFYDVCEANGGYYAVGSSNSTNRDLITIGNRGGLDGIVVKFSDSGEVQSVEGFGGTYDEKFNAVCALKNGSIIAVGDTLSSDGDLVGNSAVPSETNSVGVVAKFQ